MDKKRALLAIALIALVTGLWIASEKVSDPSSPAPGSDEIGTAPAMRSTSPSALPNADAARARRVRSAIAEGSYGDMENYVFRDQVVATASLLTDDELIAALKLVEEPNYAIEDLCTTENLPLERRLALLNHFVDIQDEEGMQDAIQGTAYLFAQSDPAATREWLRRFEPGIGHGQGLSAVFDRLDETDPAASLAMLCDLDEREAEAILGYGDGARLDHLSGREIVALVDAFKSERLREFHLSQTVVYYLAKDDPEDALAFLRDLPANERQASHGRQWVQVLTRPEMAPDFPTVIERMTTELPPEAQSPENYRVLAEAWYCKSPTEARAWIDTLAAGSFRDAAITGYARDSVFTDAAAAYALALTMSDISHRQRTGCWALRNLAKENPDAARAVLPNAELLKGDRESLERLLAPASESTPLP